MPEDKLLKQVTAEHGMNADTSAGVLNHRSGRGRLTEEERRGCTRYSVSAFAEVIEQQTNTHLRGRVTDLGLGGCYVDAISPFPVGTEVQVHLSSGQRTFQSQATVIYAIPGMGMGLAFSEMPSKQATILETWIGELSGEVKPQTTIGIDSGGDFQANIAPENPTKLSAAVAELISLLARKQLLTDSEASELRKKLSC